MDPSQNTKNTDCYFYYYSACSRDTCPYRHEPSSRGCETTCPQWKEGKCTNQYCNLRHMEIKKKRNEISCYWENQPSGCLKAHCPFLHRKKANAGQTAAPPPVQKEADAAMSSHEIPQWNVRANHESLPGTANAPEAVHHLSQAGSEPYGSPQVEPVIVTFEEESDSESTNSWTLTKKTSKEEIVGVAIEELRLLEDIQAQQAAYWRNVAGGPIFWEDEKPFPIITSASAERAFARKVQATGVVKLQNVPPKSNNGTDLDFKILTLEEIRRNRQARSKADESAQCSTPTSTTKPSISSRLGCQSVENERTNQSQNRCRTVSSSTESGGGRLKVKRERSPVIVSRPSKRFLTDSAVRPSSTIFDDTDVLMYDIDEYLAK